MRRTINSIIDEEGKEVSTKDEAMKIIQNFYQKLYNTNNSSKPHTPKIGEKLKKKALNDDEANELGKLITVKEIHTALKEMKNEKSPGSDGLTKEFCYILEPFKGYTR